jgi:WD40 repeat protein
VLTASDDRTGRLWNAVTGNLVSVLKARKGGINYAGFSPDGARILASSKGNGSWLLDARTGTILGDVSGYRARPSSMVFSPDSRFILTSTDFGTPWLWNGKTAAEFAEILQDNGAVNTRDRFGESSFSPAGVLLAMSERKSTRIWRLPPRCQSLINQARAHQLRELLPAERTQFFIHDDSNRPFLRIYAALRPWISWMLPSAGDTCPQGPRPAPALQDAS